MTLSRSALSFLFLGLFFTSSAFAIPVGTPGHEPSLPQADLSLTLSDAPELVFIGKGINLTYTITVTNNGPNPAEGVVVKDLLTGGPTVVSHVSTVGSCNSMTASLINCNLGTLSMGQSATITIIVTPINCGNLSNTAEVSSEMIEDVQTNNNSDQTYSKVRYPMDLPPGPPGTLDQTFDCDGKVTTDLYYSHLPGQHSSERAEAVVIQPDGKIVVAGYTDASKQTFLLARYDPDGSLDTTFGDHGTVITKFAEEGVAAKAYAFDLALQADGKIVAAGYFDSYVALARYNPLDGSLDTSFDDDGKVFTVVMFPATGPRQHYGRMAIQPAEKVALKPGIMAAISPQEKIVFAGGDRLNPSSSRVRRFLPNGDPDPDFGGDGEIDTIAGASDLVVQPDGSIVVLGIIKLNEFTLARYIDNGSPDTAFGTGGKVTITFDPTGFDINTAYQPYGKILLQPDGKLLVAGYRHINELDGYSERDIALARFHPNGSPDTTFDGDGKVVTNIGPEDTVNAIALQPNGKILVAGSILTTPPESGDRDFLLVRYNSNGSLDTSFDTDGWLKTDLSPWDSANGIAIQPDGRIVLAGYSHTLYNFNVALARYWGDPTMIPVTPVTPLKEPTVKTPSKFFRWWPWKRKP